ncbi:hypothetical protein M4D71_25670 [Niallia taxi]|uniref:hypothetical protein n=1 Tax=Niallia taxi TaxID=2499688 RepID=UPI0021A5CB5F|nr:hypothetical protein [Niallia taxi]MCT2347540.1 hypothetical protein [Niallia taxi]
MHNMFVTAVRLKFMDINAVPEAFRADVKKELGIEDPVIEQPVETVVEIPEQPVEEAPIETTPTEVTAEQPTETE